jgi:O-antigen ligase
MGARPVLVLLAAGLLIIPTLYSSGMEAFRLPKELAFRAEAIALMAAAVFWATSARRTWTRRPRPEFLLAGAIVLWAALTAAFSTNRALSADSFLTVVAAAVIFVATCIAARTTRSLVAVDVLMAAACANAAVVLLQELDVWSPFTPAIGGHYGSVGFLGNTNDVGTFLAAPALAALVVAATTTGARRWIYAAICALLVAGLAASASRAAVGALVVGLMVFAVRQSRRAAIASAVAIGVLVVMTLIPSTPLGERAPNIGDAASTRDYERLYSERLLPILACVDMARDHPLLGVGPGCFRYRFMAYRVNLRGHYPEEWTRGYPGNWGAAHNDHLQVAAESGLPGYALFLVAIAITGLRGRGVPRSRGGGTAAFAGALRLPLAALVFVLCLAQFPLELAAPRLILITLAALCITWDGEAIDAAA